MSVCGVDVNECVPFGRKSSQPSTWQWTSFSLSVSPTPSWNFRSKSAPTTPWKPETWGAWTQKVWIYDPGSCHLQSEITLIETAVSNIFYPIFCVGFFVNIVSCFDKMWGISFCAPSVLPLQTSISWSPSAAWWSAPRSSSPRCRRLSSSARCAPSAPAWRWIAAASPSRLFVATATPPTAWHSFTIAPSFQTNRWWESDGVGLWGRLRTVNDT